MKYFTVLLVLCFVSIKIINAQRKIICNYSPTSYKRSGDGIFLVENIDASLCTHFVYSYLKIERFQLTYWDREFDLEQPKGLGNLKNFTDLRQVKPYPKAYGAVGGFNDSSRTLSYIAQSDDSRDLFVESAANFLYYNNFDGLLLDWEYPTKNGGTPEDKDNFVVLLKDLKQKFDELNLEVAISVAATKSEASKYYKIDAIHSLVDFINLKTLNFKSPWDKVTGYIAPLRSNDEKNIEKSVEYWLEQGAPSDKLVISIPFYGNTYTLKDSEKNGIGAPVTDAGKPGPFSGQPGFLAYNEICHKNWQEEVDEENGALYTYLEDEWISYDNNQTIGMKIDYIMEKDLGGVMIWNIENDDFKGICDQGKFPLLNMIFKGLN